MKALNNAFTEDRTVDDEEIYLFVFNSEAANVESGILLGDMPISSQFGYIFSPDGESIAAKTIAHELGHGMFQLKHTFDDRNGIKQGTTDNLMDYSTGTELVKQQWDEIYDPQKLLFAWAQSDEDGEAKKDIRPKKVTFKEQNYPDYAFDANTKSKCKNYPTYADKNNLDDGTPWTYVFENTSKTVAANVVPSSTVGKFVLKSDITSTILNNTNNPAQIQLQTTSPLNYFVIAKDTVGVDNTLGGLNVISQPVSLRKSYIVKIYRLKCPSESNYPTVNTTAITNKLNDIYSVCGASFVVSSVAHDLAFNLDTNKNGYYDNYDNAERILLNQTMNSLSVSGEISVFVLNDKIQSKDKNGNIVIANGFSPLNRKYPVSLSKPYVVLTGQNTIIPETLAHEIGHGVFGFRHPFDEFSFKGQTKGQDPNNIMDYNRATGYCGLRAYQILIINQFDMLRLWIDN